jgi:hypothetical protein
MLFYLLLLWPVVLAGQQTFPLLVDRAFGSDQVLVNGIQFSNQYIRAEGDPYWRDYLHREGAVCINDQWFSRQIWLRYNLYSSRVEMEYISPEGDRNQLITVPEQMSAFIIDGTEFRKMQMGEEEPAYFQVHSSGSSTCYVKWSMEMRGEGSSDPSFAPARRAYWLDSGELGPEGVQWITFHDRKSYLEAFPSERQKHFKRLLKQQKFSFKQATIPEMEQMIEATIHLYEEEAGQ